MSNILGIRRLGSASIAFVAMAPGIDPLLAGRQVTVEHNDQHFTATVVIGSGQLVADIAGLTLAGVIVSALEELPSRGHPSSKEDAAYRHRKAAYPTLGARFDSKEASGRVERIDLRHRSIAIRDEANETTTVIVPEMNCLDDRT